MLTREEEIECGRRIRDSLRAGELDYVAHDKLVTAHIRLVVGIAKQYFIANLPFSDLVSEGHHGLLLAARKFDIDFGRPFSAFAKSWIRSAITEYIVRTKSLVKMGTTAHEKKVFWGLARAEQTLGLPVQDNDCEHIEKIAATLGVPVRSVAQMKPRLRGEVSLDAPIDPNQESNATRLEYLRDDRNNPEEIFAVQQEREIISRRQTFLNAALDMLSERERHIIVERRLKSEPTSLACLGGHYGLSRERIFQIEVKAFKQLKKSMLALAEAAKNEVINKKQCAPQPQHVVTYENAVPS